MEIDHFNPILREAVRNRYSNLYLSSGHCNRRKSDYWPTEAMKREGIRLLDPCAEMDYGEHIFEDPNSHLLVGVTPAGRYHIRVLDLNAETFVSERQQRAICRATRVLEFNGDPWEILAASLAVMQQLVDALIPCIPPPPAEEPPE
jgi:hypothetical protein